MGGRTLLLADVAAETLRLYDDHLRDKVSDQTRRHYLGETQRYLRYCYDRPKRHGQGVVLLFFLSLDRLA